MTDDYYELKAYKLIEEEENIRTEVETYRDKFVHVPKERVDNTIQYLKNLDTLRV